jgi:hypothetical protein
LCAIEILFMKRIPAVHGRALSNNGEDQIQIDDGNKCRN